MYLKNHGRVVFFESWATHYSVFEEAEENRCETDARVDWELGTYRRRHGRVCVAESCYPNNLIYFSNISSLRSVLQSDHLSEELSVVLKLMKPSLVGCWNLSRCSRIRRNIKIWLTGSVNENCAEYEVFVLSK